MVFMSNYMNGMLFGHERDSRGANLHPGLYLTRERICTRVQIVRMNRDSDLRRDILIFIKMCKCMIIIYLMTD